MAPTITAATPCAVNADPRRPCREQASPLRTDGLCYAHGKERDGLLSMKITPLGGQAGRPPKR